MNELQVETITTRTGTQLLLRPLRPIDAPLLVNLFQHLGSYSRYLRFNAALSDPDPALVVAEAKRMASVSGDEGRAWIALAGASDSPVAGARYLFSGCCAAEVSMAVRDDTQGTGIGSALLHFLADKARADGVERLTATVHLSNRAIWRLLKSSGYQYSRILDGPTANVVVEIAAKPAPSLTNRDDQD